LESPDVPLRWLRDQALSKRIDDEGPDIISDCSEMREYVLETIDQEGVPLNLDMPICSTGCSEFLLLRINSSRGDFSLSPYRTVTECSKQMSKASTNAPSADRPEPLGRGVRGVAEATLSLPSLSYTDFASTAMANVYLVERVHRYMPNSSVSLSINFMRIFFLPLTRFLLQTTRFAEVIFYDLGKSVVLSD
uniref:Protein-serine/threonine phosphatase n=1 Tax=Gongylonema pulchrum TaxID=637853 RepID=A0A183E0G6_9BILA